jgi:hypothetical protein
MVFMREDEGRPLPALLLLFSMFAFAFVFHVVTRPQVALEAQYNTATPALQAAIESHNAGAPSAPGVKHARGAEAAHAIVARVTFAEIVELTGPVAIAPSVSVAPSVALAPVELAAPGALGTPVALAVPVEPVGPATVPVDRGAVTRGFATTGSVVRAAFKRAF